MMKAVGLIQYLPISDPQSLIDVSVDDPVPGARDLLVRVQAVSVNPVDTKVRAPKAAVEKAPRILGWDAAGVVEAVGEKVTGFKRGDAVYYAGSITRPGCNSEFQLVDERIAALKPAKLSMSEAAALPLTAVTAWEAFFDRLAIDPGGADRGRTMLIIGGAGGVGSIGIQLAKLAGLRVIATASRSATREWVTKLGSDHVVNHREPLAPQLKSFGLDEVDYIANFSNTDLYWTVMAELIRPQGKIVSIVENKAPLDLNLLKSKSASFAWEFMFTRPMYSTPDMYLQGEILKQLAALIDEGRIVTTLHDTLSPINAENLRKGHGLLESGTTIGKIVLHGWS